MERAIEYKTWLDEGNKDGAVGDPSKVHGVKRKSILHNLPYWKVMGEHHLYIKCLKAFKGDVSYNSRMVWERNLCFPSYSVYTFSLHFVKFRM